MLTNVSGLPTKNVRYADQKLTWSFRFFTGFIYMYFDVSQICVLLIFCCMACYYNVLYGHFIIKSYNVCQFLSAVYVV